MLETCGNIIYLGDAKETTGGGGTGGVSDHNDLTGRSALNQHPIKAISGLEDKLTEIENKIPGNLTTQGNEFNNANQLVKLDNEGKLPAIDGSNLLNLPTGPSSTSSYGIKGDYFSKYGITKCQNGLIKTTLDSKEVVVLAGIECFMPGATTKITIASNITYEVQATTKTTLFLAGAEIIESEDVFYQEIEPEDGSSTYVAWYNPKANEWKFKSNDTGNVFRTVRATPIADVYVDGSNITRIDYIGYRVFNDTIYATKDDLDTVSNSLSTKQDALTTDQLNAINSGITETNFNELNIEVETIKNDQETLGNDLGTLSNTVGLKDDLPDTSKSITQNISSINTKIAENIIHYSTTETFTGKYWIDGKPVYRTVAHTTIPNDSNKYVIQEFDGTNIDRLITLYGGVKHVEELNQTTISFYRDTTDGLFLYFDNALKRLCAKSNTIGGGDAYIVLEYTKV